MIPGTTIGALHILKAAFFSTSHASAQDAIAGRERPFTTPAYRLLVGRARRFTSLVTQMHVEVCGALQPEAQHAPAVFATCHGEIQTCERLISDFRDTSIVSSAGFALSVHNAASGLYSVATGSTAPTTTVTGANAVAAGWLEAAMTALDGRMPVLLSIADEPVPAVFRGPSTAIGVAAAFLVGAGPDGANGGGRCTAELAVAACNEDDEEDQVDLLEVLARTADASERHQPARIALGRIQPGARLELRLSRPEADA